MLDPAEIVADTSVDLLQIVIGVQLNHGEVVQVKIVIFSFIGFHVSISIFSVVVELLCLVFSERPAE